MLQGHYGLGIMIVEGRHADVGKGIFISDVQIGSVAEEVSVKLKKIHHYFPASMII